MNIDKIFKEIEKFRKEHNMNISTFCSVIDISTMHYNNMKNGNVKSLTPNTIDKLIKYGVLKPGFKIRVVEEK